MHKRNPEKVIPYPFKQSLGIMLPTVLGTLIEWAEYTFYGYIAIKLSGLFFPHQSTTIGLLQTFAIFASGYLMRPLGALLFGHIGDKYGRIPALMGSMLLMGITGISIGLLPTYAQIGILAPLFLLLLRLLQGLAVGGEYNGAGIFLIEKIGFNYPCLAGSWVSAAAAAGMVTGGLCAYFISLPSMPSWAWRVPFIIGGFSCWIALWLRKKSTDSISALHKNHIQTLPALQHLKQYFPSLLSIGVIAAFTGVFVYIGNIYYVIFLIKELKLSTQSATLYAIFGETLVMITIPIMGYIADKTNPVKQYFLGLALVFFMMPLIFWLSAKNTPFALLSAMTIYGIINGITCGPMVFLLVALPERLRYRGVSLAYSLAAGIFAGTAPMVAITLSAYANLGWLNTWLYAPAAYVSLFALIAFIVLMCTHKATHPLRIKKAYHHAQ